MIEFHSADSLPLEALVELMNLGYEDYVVPTRFDAATLGRFLRSNDIARVHSLAATRNGDPVGVALLGVRGTHGWLGAIGVVRAARRSGLGRTLLGETIASARRVGIESLRLEVLVENAPAIPLYQTAGFRDVRELEVLVRPPGPPPAPPAGIAIEAVPIEQWLATLDRRPAPNRPWQRGPEVMLHEAVEVRCLALRAGGVPIAGVVARPAPGRGVVLDLAAAPDAPPGALDAALARLLGDLQGQGMAMLNLDPADPARAALLAAGFEPKHRQREMRLAL